MTSRFPPTIFSERRHLLSITRFIVSMQTFEIPARQLSARRSIWQISSSGFTGPPYHNRPHEARISFQQIFSILREKFLTIIAYPTLSGGISSRCGIRDENHHGHKGSLPVRSRRVPRIHHLSRTETGRFQPRRARRGARSVRNR